MSNQEILNLASKANKRTPAGYTFLYGVGLATDEGKDQFLGVYYKDKEKSKVLRADSIRIATYDYEEAIEWMKTNIGKTW